MEAEEEDGSAAKVVNSLAADSGDAEFSAGREHAEDEVCQDAPPNTRTHSSDGDNEGSRTPAHCQSTTQKITPTSSNGAAATISRVSLSSVGSCDTSPAPASFAGQGVGTGEEESKHAYQVDNQLEEGEGGAGGGRVLTRRAQSQPIGGKQKIDHVQSILDKIQADMRKSSSASSRGRDELVCLADVAGRSKARSGDMRKHFAASTHPVTIDVDDLQEGAAQTRRSQRADGKRAVQKLKFVQVLSYPQNNANAVTVTLGDVERLQDGQFLNDSLIDFW
jgi:hypothetical protein